MITYGEKTNTESVKNEFVIARLQKACDLLGWSVSVTKQSNNYYFEFENYTGAGQDIVEGFDLDDYQDEDAIRQALYDMWRSFDPDEEASLWVGEDGHGKNGAPHSLRAILEDMEDAKDMLKRLADCYNNRGVSVNMRDAMGCVRTISIEEDYTITDGMGEMYNPLKVVPSTDAQAQLLYWLADDNMDEARLYLEDVQKEFDRDEEIPCRVFIDVALLEKAAELDLQPYIDALHDDLERPDRECKIFLAIALSKGYNGVANGADFSDDEIEEDVYHFFGDTFMVGTTADLRTRVYDNEMNNKECWKAAVMEGTTEDSLETFANEMSESSNFKVYLGMFCDEDCQTINNEEYTILYY